MGLYNVDCTCHYVITPRARQDALKRQFDYQSNRHCAKTDHGLNYNENGLITSQIDTAPKRGTGWSHRRPRLITSQIDTAPKPTSTGLHCWPCLITSQIDTAPKRLRSRSRSPRV